MYIFQSYSFLKKKTVKKYWITLTEKGDESRKKLSYDHLNKTDVEMVECFVNKRNRKNSLIK